MEFLLQELSGQKAFGALQEALEKRGLFAAEGICEGAFAPLLAALTRGGRKRPVLVLVADERAASRLQSALKVFFDSPLFFPARDLLLSPEETRSETFGTARLEVLARLSAGECPVLISTPDAVLQTTLPPEELSSLHCRISLGETLSPEKLCEVLVRLNYVRAERVEGEGQFSRRGGIVDFFSPAQKDACRVEFFGDEVERICLFDTRSQTSRRRLSQITLLPAQEMYLPPEGRALCLSEIEAALGRQKLGEEAREFLTQQKEALDAGLSPAADTLFSLCFKEACLLDYLPGALVCVEHAPRVAESLTAAAKAQTALLESAAARGALTLASPPPLPGPDELFERLCSFSTLVFSALPTGQKEKEVFRFHTRSSPLFGERREVLFSVLRDLVQAKCRVYLFSQSDFAAQNLTEMLLKEGFSVRKGREDTLLSAGEVCVFSSEEVLMRKGRLTGFECPASHFCLLCEDSGSVPAPLLSHRRKTETSSASKQALHSYSELSVGDYVVHEAYGIGIFEGLETIRRDTVGRDFLKIRYAGSDVLYVPASNLSSLSKYIGRGSDGTLALSRMGKSTWQEHKRRAKSAARDIARDLIALYSERERCAGHAFSPDSPWQAQFEESFEYEETEGQLRAVQEVKEDMEKPRPMDRLLCGDVGFGKTEVALRAVFKCVMDSKQAAILAPTTLLCQQHYRTVLARFRSYPVRVEMLSRFSTKKEIASTLAALKDGSCDIVIGTHRLLQKDVRFSRLGLLVVDEEQRFGVTHKEALKTLSKGVDVLTLTATPIPRTLNMALSGVRDLSLLEEAPGDRLPVQTVVAPFDEALVLGAIRKELSRRGQVFYLVNDIERLPGCAARIAEQIPGARVRYAHGRLEREELSELWQQMQEGEIDVLVCTTIVETGIDLPSANTLIVEHAERFGLSQLHQLRGRVGRSFRRAYAYFTYPPMRALPEIAEKRLSAIREFARFGSGFQLAMRDLELRGAGSLLGAAQSGHMEKIGYDLYMRILSDAVLEEKGITPEKTPDCYIDLPIRARLSEDYVPASSDRIALYQRFSALLDEAMEAPLREELADRFGPLPAEAENLFLVAALRREALALGFSKVSLTENVLSFFAEEFHEGVLTLLAAVYGRYFYVSSGEKKRLNLRLVNRDPIEEVRDFFLHYRSFSETLHGKKTEE